MKPLVLDSVSILLPMKNKEKYFGASETHHKGRPALKVTVYEHTYLDNEI